MKDVRAYCVKCAGELIKGPRGGMSVNCACPVCKVEYNLAIWRDDIVMAELVGALASGRAILFGIDL